MKHSVEFSKKNVKKFNGNCYNYGKDGHRSIGCRMPKKQVQVNITESDAISDIYLTAIISECNNFVNSIDWWVDMGVTCHICANKGMFSSYTPTDGGKLFMENSLSSKVEGQGKVILKMTWSKELSLNNILHVSNIRKNLVLGSMLSKTGFKLVFVSAQFILTKSNMYEGKY